jgi:hypothetical protein
MSTAEPVAVPIDMNEAPENSKAEKASTAGSDEQSASPFCFHPRP